MPGNSTHLTDFRNARSVNSNNTEDAAPTALDAARLIFWLVELGNFLDAELNITNVLG
jgi:hypothetical protein